MKKFFGYTRVSTVKQGEHGVSLKEQRDAIERYVQRNNLEIASWFEEQQTAAKRGRPVFSRMIKLLRSGQSAGVIIHKIDRSARNLKDWADLGELIDSGVEVHFANEALDLNSRGGRLSADIQAVVAADYIRNLREETKKGFYGRLKQGLFPRPAPMGYLNTKPGQVKIVDPKTAPLVKQAFQIYAEAKVNLKELVEQMFALGLKSPSGKKYHPNSLSLMLNNQFYMGLIRIKKNNETFAGQHEAIISKSLYDRVQEVLTGKTNKKINKYEFLFRRLFHCNLCGHCLVGETHKGHVYYRCHTKNCETRYFTERRLEEPVVEQLKKLEFTEEEKTYFQKKLQSMNQNDEQERGKLLHSLKLQQEQVNARTNKLTDAYLDQALDREAFE